MENFDGPTEFGGLLKLLPELVAMAEEMKTPNPEDDIFSRIAIVGFSYHCPTEQWDQKHFSFIRGKCRGDYSDSALKAYGKGGRQIGIFACLSFGYLLGLFQSSKISEAQFQIAEAQLPGFIFLNLKTLTSGG